MLPLVKLALYRSLTRLTWGSMLDFFVCIDGPHLQLVLPQAFTFSRAILSQVWLGEVFFVLTLEELWLRRTSSPKLTLLEQAM